MVIEIHVITSQGISEECSSTQRLLDYLKKLYDIPEYWKRKDVSTPKY